MSLKVYNAVPILWLQYMIHVMLFPMIKILYIYSSTFRSMCTMPNMAVFCSPLISCFSGKLLRYLMIFRWSQLPLSLLLSLLFLHPIYNVYLLPYLYIFQHLFGYFLDHISAS